MGSNAKKKVRITQEEYEDRMSRLPDELIHKILSFADAKEAVQTSVLSKRWKLIWTTLPFLDFGGYDEFSFDYLSCYSMFIRHVLSNRNHQSNISELKMYVPALTTLHLVRPYLDVDHKLPESCLTCLPALRTLYLDLWDLSKSSFLFNLPDLTTLRLFRVTLSQTVWDLPALVNLDLHCISIPENMSDMFSTLVNLKNLTLFLSGESMQQDHFIIISCPQLLNLNITTRWYAPPYAPPYGNIVVSAPKLCNFSSVGIFSITFGIPELENVNIRLRDWFMYMDKVDKRKYYQRFTYMLSGLGNAKNLSFDLESIEALAEISNFLASFSSPFYNLKCVKLPKEYKESSIPSELRSYLLGGSPRATIVTSLPQKNRIPQTPAVSVAAENAVLLEPFTAPTKELGNCQYINKTVSVDTVDMGVQEQHVVENYPVDADRVRQIDASVKGVSNDQNLGFNISWVVSRLDYVDHLRFSQPLIPELHAIDCRIDDDKNKLQDLQARVDDTKSKLQVLQARVDDANTKLKDVQTLRVEKMTEIDKAFGTLGTTLAVGFIGDDLLSGP